MWLASGLLALSPVLAVGFALGFFFAWYETLDAITAFDRSGLGLCVVPGATR
jgi:hypothetical protein